MDFSDVYNSDIRVKEEPNDFASIENGDNEMIGNAHDANTEESLRCRENFTHGPDDVEVEFECKDEKLGINLLVVEKIEDDYPDHLQHMTNSSDNQSRKKIKEEIVDEIKEELNLDGELSDAFDANEKTFAQNTWKTKRINSFAAPIVYVIYVINVKLGTDGSLNENLIKIN
uniref:Uncharacterized protein n=1 Tax=Trichogramma kaykai TaxID=54128 RepID=A0ABD2W0L4_9HYME